MIAAITAGGRVDGELAAAFGTTVKALAPLGGGLLVDAAIAAARDAGAARVVLVGGDAVRARYGGRVDAVVEETADGAGNIARAVRSGDPDEALLLLTSDMPFVRGDDLAAFVERARGADVALPLAEARAYELAYPGAPPHVTRVGRDRVANGSAVWFAPGVAERALPVARRLFDARKSLARMAVLLGPALLARFALGTLGIEDVERRAARTLGLRALGVRGSAPGLCFDVDTLADYRYAQARLAAP